jgi:hypothetical protein
VKSLEHDFTGSQRRGFKILKKLQLEVSDQVQTNLISREIGRYITVVQPWHLRGGGKEMVETVSCEEDITMEELDYVLKKGKNRKSPGIDNLNVELFKYGSALLKSKLLHLFNNIWHNLQVPKDWETRIVINIHKKALKITSNRRGITKLSMASKLYANILKYKLNRPSESVLEEEQCGFRRGRNTMDAILTL